MKNNYFRHCIVSRAKRITQQAIVLSKSPVKKNALTYALCNGNEKGHSVNYKGCKFYKEIIERK